MLNVAIHNITEVPNCRVHGQDHDDSGWITFNVVAQNYSWGDEDEQDNISNEVTFFFKNKELGLAQLQEAIRLAIKAHRKDEAVAAELEASNG
jgi:hypothetical protein